MIKTEKKHWVNGYQRRGGGLHKTITISLWRYGLMIVKVKGRPLYIELFELI